jgi:hypothetical protein
MSGAACRPRGSLHRWLSLLSAAFAAGLLLLGANTSHATAYGALTLDERLEVAVDVFVGRVAAVEGERRGDDPWTLITFDVLEWLLRDGAATDEGPLQVTLAFLGGQAPGTAPRQVAGFPSFALGERMLVASYGDDSRAASPLVGVTQGLWREQDDAWRDAAGEALALDTTGRPQLADEGDPEALWLPALAARLRELRGEP